MGHSNLIWACKKFILHKETEKNASLFWKSFSDEETKRFMTLTPDPKFSLQRELERAFFKKNNFKNKNFSSKTTKTLQKCLFSPQKFVTKHFSLVYFFLPKKVKSFLDFFQAKTNLKKNELTERSTRSFPDWMTSF